MNCSDRKKALSDYCDGALGYPERKELEKHLQTCPSCREMLEEMEATDRLAREIISAEEPAPEEWEQRWDGMRKKILDGIERTPPPPERRSFLRLRLRPIAAAAAVILLLAGGGLIWRLVILQERIEDGRRTARAAAARMTAAVETSRFQTAAASKDLSLFRGVQQSFSIPVRWMSIDGEAVEFDLAEQGSETPAGKRQPLLLLAFRILHRNGEDRSVSAPRIIARNAEEIESSFVLGPDSDLTYHLRATPRIAGGDTIALDIDLVFREAGGREEKKARLSVSPTIETGKATVLGSVFPGNELYRIEVLTSVEDFNDPLSPKTL